MFLAGRGVKLWSPQGHVLCLAKASPSSTHLPPPPSTLRPLNKPPQHDQVFVMSLWSRVTPEVLTDADHITLHPETGRRGQGERSENLSTANEMASFKLSHYDRIEVFFFSNFPHAFLFVARLYWRDNDKALPPVPGPVRKRAPCPLYLCCPGAPLSALPNAPYRPPSARLCRQESPLSMWRAVRGRQ